MGGSFSCPANPKAFDTKPALSLTTAKFATRANSALDVSPSQLTPMDEMWLFRRTRIISFERAVVRIFPSQPMASVVADVLHSIQFSCTSPQVLFESCNDRRSSHGVSEA